MSTSPTPPPAPQPPSGETPGQAIDQVKQDVTTDIADAKAEAAALYAAARKEYDSLAPAVQRKIHQFLNDLESAGSISLGGIHTLFGAK